MAEIIKIHDPEEQRERLKSVSDWKVPAATKIEFKRFLEELALGKVNKGTKLSEPTRLKYVTYLKVPLEFFNKPTQNVQVGDVEAFEQALSSDQIISSWKATPYSHSTKVGIRKALKIYFRWKRGKAASEKLAGWLDTKSRQRTPNYLTENEIERLFTDCRTPEQRYAVAILFDSGARAEEFINIRFEDLRLPEGTENFAKLTLRDEFSKTQGRTISLYWNQSLGAIKAYLNKRISEGIRPGEVVFNNTYDAMRMFLARLGTKVLSKHIHPHLFRHSSATYYATKLNRQELCYRYGWRFSSNMPDVYISRAGMEHKQLDEKFASTEITALQGQLKQLQLDLKLRDERLQRLERKMAAVEFNFPEIAKVVSDGQGIGQVEMALKKRRGFHMATD